MTIPLLVSGVLLVFWTVMAFKFYALFKTKTLVVSDTDRAAIEAESWSQFALQVGVKDAVGLSQAVGAIPILGSPIQMTLAQVVSVVDEFRRKESQ